MSQTETITFDDFNHWRKAALVKEEEFEQPKKVTLYPTTRDGPIAELYPTGEVKMRPQEATGDGQPVSPAWVNTFGAWINAFKELGEVGARQWGPDWMQRRPSSGEGPDQAQGPQQKYPSNE